VPLAWPESKCGDQSVPVARVLLTPPEQTPEVKGVEMCQT